MIETTDAQRAIIQHALGGKAMYRNYYATEPGSDDFDDIEDLVKAGLMRRGRNIPGGLVYFHVTDAGKRRAFN